MDPHYEGLVDVVHRCTFFVSASPSLDAAAYQKVHHQTNNWLAGERRRSYYGGIRHGGGCWLLDGLGYLSFRVFA